jgi:hypothetical protein
MIVRLAKKLAETMDGVDLSRCAEGDVIELPERRAEVLIAEGWAERVSASAIATSAPVCQPDTMATPLSPGWRRRLEWI